jgi:predicted deacetylase
MPSPDVPALLVSVHDVAPATLDQARRWAWHLDERDVPITFQVIPGPWRGRPLDADPSTRTWLWVRQCGGDEIALHGWTHRAEAGERSLRRTVGRCIARGTEEFWELGSREAAERVRAGLDVLARAELEALGFTPPGWLIAPHARHAVGTCGLRYLADHRGVHDLGSGRVLRAPALTLRAGGRGERTGALAFAAMVRRRARAGLPVRIALHPEDLDRPELAGIALDAIDDALEAGLRPSTTAAAMGLTPASAPA